MGFASSWLKGVPVLGRFAVGVWYFMVLNAALDMLFGAVPFLGDLADVALKSNLRNLELLERHARPGVAPRRGDYAFVFVCLALVALIALAPIVAVLWLLSAFPLV